MDQRIHGCVFAVVVIYLVLCWIWISNTFSSRRRAGYAVWPGGSAAAACAFIQEGGSRRLSAVRISHC